MFGSWIDRNLDYLDVQDNMGCDRLNCARNFCVMLGY